MQSLERPRGFYYFYYFLFESHTAALPRPALDSRMTRKVSNKTTTRTTFWHIFLLWGVFIIGTVYAQVDCFPDRDVLNAAINAIGLGSGVGLVDGTYGAIEDWCFEPALTNFNYLFAGLSNFNADISNWNVSMVTDMGTMVSTLDTMVATWA